MNRLCVCLLSLNIMFIMFVYDTAFNFSFLFSFLYSIPLCEYSTIYCPSFCRWIFGLVQHLTVWIIMLWIFSYMSFGQHVYAFLLVYTQEWNSCLFTKYMVTFSRYFQIVFQTDSTSLHCCQYSLDVPIPPHFCQCLVLFVFHFIPLKVLLNLLFLVLFIFISILLKNVFVTFS